MRTRTSLLMMQVHVVVTAYRYPLTVTSKEVRTLPLRRTLFLITIVVTFCFFSFLRPPTLPATAAYIVLQSVPHSAHNLRIRLEFSSGYFFLKDIAAVSVMLRLNEILKKRRMKQSLSSTWWLRRKVKNTHALRAGRDWCKVCLLFNYCSLTNRVAKKSVPPLPLVVFLRLDDMAGVVPIT